MPVRAVAACCDRSPSQLHLTDNKKYIVDRSLPGRKTVFETEDTSRLFTTDRRPFGVEISMESLILAQDERWRRA